MKKNVMLGTALDGQGGIASVISVYREIGFFDRNEVHYIATHCEGSGFKKINIFAKGFLTFISMLITGNVGLVHIHTASDISFWRKSFFLMAAKIAARPVILHIHGGGFRTFFEKQSSFKKKCMRYILKQPATIIVLSESWKNWLQEVVHNTVIVPIYNPVQVPQKKDLSVNIPSNILFLGKLGKNKGTYDLVEAVALIVPKHPSLKVLLGGDGDIEQIKEVANKKGISHHIETLGWVSGAKKAQLFNDAAIYVLPSYAEGLPMSVLEAMAAEVAVVTTPVGGIPEAISDGVEGFLITPGDINGLAEALDLLLSDNALRRNMAKAGREKVENLFSSEHVNSQIETLYQKLGAVR